MRDLSEVVTYKPGWTFKAHPYHQKLTGIVVVGASVPSSSGNGKNTRISHTVHDVDLDSESDIVLACAQGIRTLEEHEFKEFFKAKGVRVFDPHPELSASDE